MLRQGGLLPHKIYRHETHIRSTIPQDLRIGYAACLSETWMTARGLPCKCTVQTRRLPEKSLLILLGSGSGVSCGIARIGAARKRESAIREETVESALERKTMRQIY